MACALPAQFTLAKINDDDDERYGNNTQIERHKEHFGVAIKRRKRPLSHIAPAEVVVVAAAATDVG